MISVFIAYAERSDTGESSLLLILLSVAILLATALIAFVPVAIAWSRRHRKAHAIAAAAVVWGLLTAGSGISATMTQMKWSSEKTMRLESGYYDAAAANDDAPPLPWPMWTGLAVAHVGLMGWAVAKTRMTKSE